MLASLDRLERLQRKLDRLLPEVAPAELPADPAEPAPRTELGFVEFVEGSLGFRLRVAQRALGLVAFDRVNPEDLDGAEREAAERLFGPVDEVPPAARRVLALVKGGRCGGSWLSALYSLWRALTADLSRLAPGERASALMVAPDMRLGRHTLRYALGALEAHPELGAWIPSRTQDSFTVKRPDWHMVTVEVLPATRGGSAVRGRWLVSAVLDECAFFRDASAVVNDKDVFQAVAPRVLPGGMVLLASTPWLEQGVLYEEFERNFGTPTTSLAAHAPTLLLLDTEDTKTMVEAERERDPDNARREFDAEFVTGGGGLLFGPELLKGALDKELPLVTTNPGPGVRVTIAGDIGLVNDASAIVAIHEQDSIIRAAEALEMRPRKGQPLKLSEVVATFCAFAERHGQKTIHCDHHALEPAREHLPKGFTLSPVPAGQEAKATRWLDTRAAFRQSRVKIPGKLSRICIQLGQVVGKPVAGGGTQIVEPRRAGSHLDLGAAFVVGVWAALHRFQGSTAQPKNLRKRAFASSGGY